MPVTEWRLKAERDCQGGGPVQWIMFQVDRVDGDDDGDDNGDDGDVDLVPIVWHTAPPKVRRPRNRVLKKSLFLGVFLEKKVFLAKRSTFT